jgi:hypothetical protein
MAIDALFRDAWTLGPILKPKYRLPDNKRNGSGRSLQNRHVQPASPVKACRAVADNAYSAA